MSTTTPRQQGPASAPAGHWAVLGPASGDLAYRTQTITHTPADTALSESVGFRTVFLLWLKAAVLSSVAFVMFFMLWIMVVSLDTGDTDALGNSSGGDSHLGVLSLGSVVSFVLFWLIFLLSAVEEPLGEWKVLMPDLAPAADSAYAAIYGSLRRRSIPVSAVALRIRSDILVPEAVNNRLAIRDRSYVAYVSVFPYGTGLYVGWTMWRDRRGAVIVAHYLKDLVGSMIGRTGPVSQMLRTEKVRAMREAVHAATREGVEVVASGTTVPIATTFGQDIPIQSTAPEGAFSPAYAPPGGVSAPPPAAEAGTPRPSTPPAPDQPA